MIIWFIQKRCMTIYLWSAGDQPLPFSKVQPSTSLPSVFLEQTFILGEFTSYIFWCLCINWWNLYLPKLIMITSGRWHFLINTMNRLPFQDPILSAGQSLGYCIHFYTFSFHSNLYSITILKSTNYGFDGL